MEEKFEIADWEKFVYEQKIPRLHKDAILYRVRKAYHHVVPVIIDFHHLSSLLGLKTSVLGSMVYATPSFYKSFQIPKRKGGFRTIVAPRTSLLESQRWISENILSKQKIHDSAFAYVRNRNIVQNAQMHAQNKYVLKMDLIDFFGNIKIDRVKLIFSSLGYESKVSEYLAAICTLNGNLPQGGATSPLLSNIIMSELDKKLSAFAKSEELVYTRYADDLVFSGSYDFGVTCAERLEKMIEDFNFSINLEKTKYYSSDRPKIITGLLVANGRVRLPKSKRKQIRSDVFFLKEFGILEQVKFYDDLFYFERIIGKLHFWKLVEPENEFVTKQIQELTDLYKELDINP